MSNYPDYRQAQMGYDKESKTIDKDDIIKALEEENRELRESNKALSDGITAQCELESEKLQILNYFVNAWDWTMQCEQRTEVIDELRTDYNMFGYGDAELRVFLECHKRDMQEKEQGE